MKTMTLQMRSGRDIIPMEVDMLTGRPITPPAMLLQHDEYLHLNDLFFEVDSSHIIIMTSSETDFVRLRDVVAPTGTFLSTFPFSDTQADLWGFLDRKVLLIPSIEHVEAIMEAKKRKSAGTQPPMQGSDEQIQGSSTSETQVTPPIRRSPEEQKMERSALEARYLQAKEMLTRWGARVNVLAPRKVKEFINDPIKQTKILMDLFLEDEPTSTLKGKQEYVQILGYSESKGKIRYYFFSNYTKREIILNQNQMNVNGFEEFAKNAPLTYWQDKNLYPLWKLLPREEKHRMQYRIEHYMRDLSDKAVKYGIKKNYQILKQGAWELKKENGDRERVFHIGPKLLDKTLNALPFGVYEDEYMLFACNGIGKFNKDPILHDEMIEMESYLTLREWEDPLAPILIMGAIYASMLSGLLRWRPHLWINAPFASGKSAISDAIVDLLGDGKGCFFAAGDKTTESGIRRGTDGKAIMVVFEEAEGETTASLEQIILLARSSSDGKPIKQTNKDSHEEDIFTCYCMFVMFSIGNSLTRAADVSRFLTFNLKKFPKGAKDTFKKLDHIRHKYWNMNMGRRLFYDAYSNATRFLAMIEHIKEELGGDRQAKNIAPLIAGYMMMRKDKTMDYLTELLAKFQGKTIKNKVNAVAPIRNVLSSEYNPDHDEFVGLLLNQEITLTIGNAIYNKPLSAWLLYLLKWVPAEEKLANKHAEVSERLGEKDITITEQSKKEPCLVMTWQSPILTAVMKSTLKNKIKTIVLDAEGHVGVIRINKFRTARGFKIPIKSLLAENDPTDEEIEELEAQELNEEGDSNNDEG